MKVTRNENRHCTMYSTYRYLTGCYFKIQIQSTLQTLLIYYDPEYQYRTYSGPRGDITPYIFTQVIYIKIPYSRDKLQKEDPVYVAKLAQHFNVHFIE